MVLETEAAIGLASAVVTFVGFTCNIASKSKQYYRSPNGMLEENHELLLTTEAFERFNDNLLSWLDASPSLKSTAAQDPKGHLLRMQGGQTGLGISKSNIDRQNRGLTSSERALIGCARRCQRIAQEFVKLLHLLKVQDGCGKWRSFREALNTFWSQDKIEDTLSQLQRAREDLMLNLLMVTRSEAIYPPKKCNAHSRP